MKKGKSVFVTVLIAAMLVVIDIGLYILYAPGFIALTGTLAQYGYFRGAGDFWRWLAKEETTAPIVEIVDVPQEHKTFDYEQADIRQPMYGGEPQIYRVATIDEIIGEIFDEYPSYRS